MRRSPHDDLRLAIDCLPERTRHAMLEGIRTNEIIVGAYTDKVGGVCPMLAAHRNGGRTNFISFARAWDRFARTRHPRKATEREVRILETMLEASLAAEAHVPLDGVIADHQALARERRAREAGEPRTAREPVVLHPDLAEALGAAEDALTAALGHEAKAKPRGGGCRIQLDFDSPAEAVELAEKLLGARR
jgi:hypothetical protein